MLTVSVYLTLALYVVVEGLKAGDRAKTVPRPVVISMEEKVFSALAVSLVAEME